MDNDNFLGRWLGENISEEEKKIFENSEDYPAYKDILKGVDKFDRPIFDIEKGLKKQKEFNKTFVQTKKNKVIKLPTWVYAAAAAVVILFGIKALLFNTTKVYTEIAETKKWTLPDNSIVTINSDSSIEYDSKSFQENRTLTLKGEAFFDVAKGSSFTVKTNNGDITVLGTEFNVYSRNRTIEVKCFEGKVEVRKNNDAIVLTPGKGIKSSNNDKLELIEITNPNPNWIQGKSTFTEVTLDRLVDELQRQYDIKIETSDVDLDRLFSGFFTHSDINKAMKTCFEPMNISYIFKDSKTIQLKNK